jgi:hypothetical protein
VSVAGSLAFSLSNSRRRDLIAQRVHELRVVPLENAEEIGDLAVAVVDHFGPWAGCAPEEDAAHPDERLGIGSMRHGRDAGHDPLGQAPLAADVSCDGADRLEGGKTLPRGH